MCTYALMAYLYVYPLTHSIALFSAIACSGIWTQAVRIANTYS